MGCNILRLAILIAIIASLIGYLFQAPNSEGIEQLNRVRALTVPMKLAYLIVCLFELGFSNYIFSIHIGYCRRILWYIKSCYSYKKSFQFSNIIKK